MIVAFRSFVMAYFMSKALVLIRCFLLMLCFYMAKASVATIVVMNEVIILLFRVVWCFINIYMKLYAKTVNNQTCQ